MCAILCHSASSIMMPHSVILSTHSVILNGVKNLLKADKRQPALIVCSQRGDASTSLSMTLLVSRPTLTPKSHCHKVTKSQSHKGWGGVISVTQV